MRHLHAAWFLHRLGRAASGASGAAEAPGIGLEQLCPPARAPSRQGESANKARDRYRRRRRLPPSAAPCIGRTDPAPLPNCPNRPSPPSRARRPHRSPPQGPPAAWPKMQCETRCHDPDPANRDLPTDIPSNPSKRPCQGIADCNRAGVARPDAARRRPAFRLSTRIVRPFVGLLPAPGLPQRCCRPIGPSLRSASRIVAAGAQRRHGRTTARQTLCNGRLELAGAAAPDTRREQWPGKGRQPQTMPLHRTTARARPVPSASEPDSTPVPCGREMPQNRTICPDPLARVAPRVAPWTPPGSSSAWRCHDWPGHPPTKGPTTAG